jgi:hypothetical protein
VAPVLAVLAVAGYLSGSHTGKLPAASSDSQHGRAIAAGEALLEYPAGWQPVSSPGAIPGLRISNPVALAPAGHTSEASLVGGSIAASQTSPLPEDFLSILRGPLDSEVINLADTQAFHYSSLDLPGYDREVELYVIPDEGNAATALACLATQAGSDYLRQCQQIVAGLTLTGSSPADLTPDGLYERRLGTLIEGLDRQRATLRARMGVSTYPATLASLASRLAGDYGSAAASLASFAPPPPAGVAQATLERALLRASAAYRTLATAAAEDSEAGSPAADQQIEEAESAVDDALRGFALLGYGSSVSP